MARALTIFTRYSDEVGKLATVTIETGTDPGDANYGPAVLVNDNPAQVAKINSTSGAWLLDFGIAQPVQLAALIHHDVDAGLEVVLQGNATNAAWGAPSFEAPFVIPAWRALATQPWPVNPWIDLTAAEGYNPAGFRFWRLLITGNSQNIQVGNLKLYSTSFRLTSDFREGLSPSWLKPVIEHQTSYRVATIYPRGTAQWAQAGTIRTESALLETLEAHWFDVDGRALPFVMVPNALRNIAYFVRMKTVDRQHAVLFYNETTDDELVDLPIAVEEVGRGLRPGPT